MSRRDQSGVEIDCQNVTGHRLALGTFKKCQFRLVDRKQHAHARLENGAPSDARTALLTKQRFSTKKIRIRAKQQSDSNHECLPWPVTGQLCKIVQRPTSAAGHGQCQRMITDRPSRDAVSPSADIISTKASSKSKRPTQARRVGPSRSVQLPGDYLKRLPQTFKVRLQHDAVR
mmetsp:Transcript_60097/g.159860  ORF Transcript_60097/g.159860 Transcript_60097/m.159860 type:complete len:174 (+) Transcript_60097:204-725(+)